MIDIIKMIIKSTLATIRWGALTADDEKLIWDAPLDKVMKASYIRRTPQSPHNVVTLE